ncbi:hypothetical protein Hlac_3424 (plasmid) [Halorubrum lacusprofundi ATCC 49239]|jgi:hypothetical protein|uniref:Uncharacterized protein n=1 Tax=Halorubrum lacusprofundi (strain ATCC 49239 / DSM 5036 / JCM 8891 / ACAM 34) TaxID=416348 RepID=B9LWU5_HALLT|nr:hypothetical protein Hlac_3424 [Halorubrum lacusprofundi ATCC 49239]
MTSVDKLRDCLASVLRQVVDKEGRQQVDQAIALINELSGPELLECLVYGCTGLPERNLDHDCRRGSPESTARYPDDDLQAL